MKTCRGFGAEGGWPSSPSSKPRAAIDIARYPTPDTWSALLCSSVRLLDELEGERIDHLWLDHDLIGNDTVGPVVDLLVHRARTGSPLNVGQIHIHTVNIGAGLKMDAVLRAAGYPVVRSYALTMWTRLL
jgi:hypothetical protein